MGRERIEMKRDETNVMRIAVYDLDIGHFFPFAGGDETRRDNVDG